MVGHHVAQSASGFVEAAAMLDANSFGGGDLHMIDVVAIPERLDDVVREAKNHQVLDGLFTEVVVDAVDLIFGEALFQVFVELDRRRVVVAEGFFDDDARPVTVFFLNEAGGAQLLDDRREKSRSDREVEKFVALRAVALVDFRDLRGEPLIRLGIVEVAFHVVDALFKPIPTFQFDLRRRVLRDFVGERLAEIFGGRVVGGKADDGELLWQHAVISEIDTAPE